MESEILAQPRISDHQVLQVMVASSCKLLSSADRRDRKNFYFCGKAITLCGTCSREHII